MRTYIDLHMHSCLSPCADELMTPNNIVNMAQIKGLDVIAVSDHNTCRNLPAIMCVAQQTGMQVIPAVELTTREEAHLLGYFPSLESALALSDAVYPHLPPIKNRPGLFGSQQVMNEEDEITQEEPKLLLTALDLSIDELSSLIRKYGGCPVPAHINRGSNGVLNALGFLPKGTPYPTLEVARALPLNMDVSGYRVLHSSDAHRLEDISEQSEYMDLPEKTAEAVFAAICAGNALA